MGIFEVLLLVCGLALFLYGMDGMGSALKKSAGRKLKTILGNLTSNKFKAFLLGLGVTAIIQSSSATTVMVVGFVNSGTMLLTEAVGVILGANVGTAVTAWLTALNGIEGGSGAAEWLNYLKTDFWMPILALVGICLVLFSKREKRRDVGNILMGFAVLMTGMSLMSDAVGGLKNDPDFANLLMLFTNPLLGVLAGLVLTAIVQSSSASVGILQALSVTGAISYGAAIPIILGQNIGTCVTAMISSLGANKNGKRAAIVHLFFNIAGVTLWLLFYYLIGWILRLASVIDVFSLASETSIDMWGIAGVHTVFKIFSVVLIAPFSRLLEKLACAAVRGEDKKGDEYTDMLDERLLGMPALAIERCRTVARHMAAISIDAFKKSLDLLDVYDSHVAEEVRKKESVVDLYEDALGSYLVKISSQDTEQSDTMELTKLLHIIGDVERISDHAVNIVESGEEMNDKNIRFSEEARSEIKVMIAAVREILSLTESAFVLSDIDKAMRVESLEEVVDSLRDQIKYRHVLRLSKNRCSIELGFVLNDILTNLERVADHSSNIAGCVIDISNNEPLALHALIGKLKKNDEKFTERYEEYLSVYSLPEAIDE